MDGLDDLEAEAQARRRPRSGNRRGEITPEPRRPKLTKPMQNTDTPAHAQAGTPTSGHAGVPVHASTDTPAPQESTATEASEPTKRTRPPSIEAYLTEDLMDWMWKVRAAGMAERKENVSSAVVRLALKQLREQMSPKQIIGALDETPAPRAKKKAHRGRAR